METMMSKGSKFFAKRRTTALAAGAILMLATGAAMAQYTPGSGGYSPPPQPYPGPQPMQPQPMQPQYSQPVQPYAQPAQPYGQPQVVQAPPAGQPMVQLLSDGQLGDLTASVALYPDPLLAQMLPAATYVEELAFADMWLAQHPGANDDMIAQLPVAPSVQTMMHYPSVLSLMADHLDWSQALGLAFTYQQADVMQAVQRWRLQAVTVGTLVTTPQQQVIAQGNTILIMPPPQTQVIYVPVYDPAVVYVRPLRPRRDVITFSAGGLSLQWALNDLDWHDHVVRVPVRRDVVVVPDGRRDAVVVTPGRDLRPGDKAVFTHDADRPVVIYPSKIEMPDHKVVVVAPDAPGRGDRGGPDRRGPDRGGQDRNGPPGTPF
jgi:hypothetical protein